jgi:hypothetical protein
MSAFAMKRRLGSKGSLGLAAAIVTTGVVSASLAFAQAVAPPPDGGPPQAAAAPIRTDCGPDIRHAVITRSSSIMKNSVAVQMLPGAHAENIVVPDGGGCLKVLFTAETACSPTANPDFCYVRAVINGVPMDPNGNGFQAMDSEDATASAHAYEWVKKLPAGNYDIDIQWSVLNAGTQFWVDDWTLDIGTYQP